MERVGEGKLFRAEPLPTRRRPGPRKPATAEQLWTDLRQLLPSPPDRWQRDRLDADAALRFPLGGGPPPDAACRVFLLKVGRVRRPEGSSVLVWSRERAFGTRFALFARSPVASRGGVSAICAADLVRVACGEGRPPVCRSAWHDPFALVLERQPKALALMLWNRGGPMLRGGFAIIEGRTSDPAPFVLERLGAAAAAGLLPPALGAPGAARDEAGRSLRRHRAARRGRARPRPSARRAEAPAWFVPTSCVPC